MRRHGRFRCQRLQKEMEGRLPGGKNHLDGMIAWSLSHGEERARRPRV
jgi:hypothetical protein